jgi:hypothetical protein
MIKETVTGVAAPLGPAIARVLGELTRMCGCHTVILFGSRARGDADADSDVDILAIGEDVNDGPLLRTVDGLDFDIWIADEKSVAADLEEYLKIEDGRPLVQRGSYGDELLLRVKARVSAGPSPLSADERGQRLRWLHRMAARASRGDDEGRYRLLWLISELPRVRFELEGRFWLGPKRSLAALAVFDPLFFELYRRVLAEPSLASTEACVHYLVRPPADTSR